VESTEVRPCKGLCGGVGNTKKNKTGSAQHKKQFKMPYAGKRKFGKKKYMAKSSALARRSAPSRMPSPMYINPRDKAHRHVVTLSNTQSTGFFPVNIQTSGGLYQFESSGTFSPNLSMEFGLASCGIKIGGFTIATFTSGNQSAFTGLYDAFILESCEVTVRASVNVNSPASTTALPIIGYAVDNDDAANTTYDALMQYGNFKAKQPLAGDPIKIKFKPAVANVIYTSSVVPAYSRSFNQQVDCTNPNAPHYGLKLSIDGMATGYSNIFQFPLVIEVKQRLLMLNTR